MARGFPAEVMRQIVARTDGVPLFVEELTKTVLEAGWLQEGEDGYELTGPLLPLAIPTTLHKTRCGQGWIGSPRAKQWRNWGQCWADVFFMSCSGPWPRQDEADVAARIGTNSWKRRCFTSGGGHRWQPTSFKHALIQEVRITVVAQEHPPAVPPAHCPRAGRAVSRRQSRRSPNCWPITTPRRGAVEQAVDYWQRAGQRAVERSAYEEAISHLSKGLEGLTTLPNGPERTQHELVLQTLLGPALAATKGLAAPETGHTYTRARELCQQVGDTPQLFPVLWGLGTFYHVRAQHQTARELGDHSSPWRNAIKPQAPLLCWPTAGWGQPCFSSVNLLLSRVHLEQGLALYDPQQHRSLALLYGT